MMFQVPITALPPGRAGFSWGVKLFYNSDVYDGTDTAGHLVYTGGWRYGYRYALWQDINPVSCGTDGNGNPLYSTFYRTILVFPDGSHHTLHRYADVADNGDGFSAINYINGAGTSNGCPPVSVPSPITYYTSDGTFIKVVITPGTGWLAYFPDGKVVQEDFTIDPVESIADRNGNQVLIHNYFQDNNPTEVELSTELADPLGRTVTINYNWNAQQDTITQIGSGSQTLTWTVNWRQILGPKYMYDQFTQLQYQAPGVDSVILPSMQEYQFGYDNDNSNDQTGWSDGQLILAIPPTAPATCSRTNLGSNCPRFTYTYAGGQPGINTPHQLTLAQRQHVWQDNVTGTQRTDTWNYSYTDVSTTTTNPDGGIVSTNYYSLAPLTNGPAENYQLKGLVTKIIQPDHSTIERVWQQNVPFDLGQYGPGNPYVKTEFQSVSNGTAPQLASAKDYTYDKNGNVILVDEYPWQTYSTSLTLPSYSTRVRSTVLTYLFPTLAAPATVDQASGYWNPASNPFPATAPLKLSLPVRKEVDDVAGQGPGSVTEFSYDTPGKLLNRFDWDSTRAPSMPGVGSLNSGNSAWHHFTYDSYGNVLTATDPICTTTSYTYASDNLYPTSIIEDDRSVQVGCSPQGAALTRITSVHFDPPTGLELNRTDYNNLSRSTVYDALGRPTSVTDRLGQGGSVLHVAQTFYSDANRRITTCTDLNTAADTAMVSVTQFDQLGRVSLTGQIETANPSPGVCNDTPVSGIITDTRYVTAAGANYTLKSNPYETLGDATMGWTLTVADTLGRVTDVKTYAGSGLPAEFGGSNPVNGTVHTSYTNADRTVTDQAGVTRTSTMDGLGRLQQVTEAGTIQTSYNYDALDNLIGVIQSGMTTPSGCPSGVSRCFAYDSLSRLKSARNPESGSTSYGYDPGGNLISKVDPRFTTTFGIDALGRVTSKSYTDPATPGVNYCYDGQSWSNGQCSGTPSAPSIGRMTQVLSSVSSDVYSYDTLGRVTANSQTTGSTPYSFQYSYNAAGLLTSETYPSQRVVSYAYNPLGRTKTVTGQLGAATTPYAGDTNNPIAYVPHGGISSLKLGNGIVETTTYNAHLQPTSIQAGTLMTLGYTYGTTQNNGNVLSQTITRGSQTWSQTYTYTDGLNRLTGASESGSGTWSQTYAYDNFGNRWLSGSSGLPSPTNQVPNGNWFSGNRVTSSPSGAWTYDNSGNLQAMAGMPGWGFTYDAENRQITAVTASSPTTTYAYDGEGRRVTKNWNGQTTTFVYDAFGNLAAEYGGPARATGTQYLTTDHLGSTRLVTDSGGAAVNCYDYLPFGEEIGSGTAGRTSCFGSGSYPAVGGAANVEFTSKERDAETGLDFFEARYMSAAQGRFASADPEGVGAFASDPQSWNGFAYARNSPLVYTDSTGTVYEFCADQGTCVRYSDPDFITEFLGQNGFRYYAGSGEVWGYAFPNGGWSRIGTARWIEPDLSDLARAVGRGAQLAAPVANFAVAATTAFILGPGGGLLEAVPEVTIGGRVVIGKMVDLAAPHPGENQLDLPNQGSPKANWAQNYSKLRRVMSEGQPIRDASAEPFENGQPGRDTGFLRAERNVLRDRGWTYRDGYWYPPK